MKQRLPLLSAFVLLAVVLLLLLNQAIPASGISLSIYVATLLGFYLALLYTVVNYVTGGGPSPVLFAAVAYAATSFLLTVLFAIAWFAFGGFGPSSGGVRPSAIDALYFSAVTFSTVGFGDFTPNTNAGKLLASLEALLGSTHTVLLFSLLFLRIREPNFLVSRVNRSRGCHHQTRTARGADLPR